jgi:hypothetical protein
MNTEPKNKLSLEWVYGAHGDVALVFDAKTWKVYQDNAKRRDKTAEQIISTAVAEALGPILIDNYVLNRFTGGGGQL